jgi:hypothetical protein
MSDLYWKPVIGLEDDKFHCCVMQDHDEYDYGDRIYHLRFSSESDCERWCLQANLIIRSARLFVELVEWKPE